MTAVAKLAVEAFNTDLYVAGERHNVMPGEGEDIPEDARAVADRILAARGYRRTADWVLTPAGDPRLPEWTTTVTDLAERSVS